MKSTKVEIHGILHLDVDCEKLSEFDVEACHLTLATHFRECFDRTFIVGNRVTDCTDCSVAVEVS